MSLEELTTKLTAHFNLDDYSTCSKLLSQIKIQLVKNNLLIPSVRTADNDLIITRSILEIGALVSINLLKMEYFSNYIIQLKPFYEIPNSKIPQSKNKNKLISLYLLFLLTQDDLASFHIELEKFVNVGLSIDELEKDEYLSIPIKFEKWIIDGDFNKVYELLSSKHNFPCKEFNLFEPKLIHSIRLNILNNLGSAYSSLPLENLKLLLFLKNQTELNELIQDFDSGWVIENGVVYFDKNTTDLTEEVNDERAIVKNALGYGKEMESII